MYAMEAYSSFQLIKSVADRVPYSMGCYLECRLFWREGHCKKATQIEMNNWLAYNYLYCAYLKYIGPLSSE